MFIPPTSELYLMCLFLCYIYIYNYIFFLFFFFSCPCQAHWHIHWGEPERAPHWSYGVPCDVYMYVSMYVYIYVCMYCTSFRKCPCVLIHWTASILPSVIQFRKCHHVQIIETASILHVQWAMRSILVCACCWRLTTHLTTVLVQLG